MAKKLKKVFVVIRRDLAEGNNANQVVGVCETVVLANKLLQELEKPIRNEYDGKMPEGYSFFIEEHYKTL